MAKLFESIGKGVGDVVGGVAKGASDLFGAIPAVRRGREQSSLREQQIINNAADMLANTPPEEQGNILAALDRIGLSKESIAAAQQIATSGQPLGVDAFAELGGEDFSRQIDLGPTGKVTGGRLATPTAGRTTIPGQLPKATVQSEILQTGISDIEADIDLIQDDDSLDSAGKIAALKPLKQKRAAARLELRRLQASQSGLVEETTGEVIPAVTRPANSLERLFGQQDIEVSPARDTTRTRFVAPNIATTKTAATELSPQDPQPATPKKKTKAGTDAKAKGKGMQTLRKALADKLITATEFKTIQNGITNGTMTVEAALARLDQIRKGQ